MEATKEYRGFDSGTDRIFPSDEKRFYGLSDWVFETLMETFVNATLKGGTDEMQTTNIEKDLP